MKRIFNVLLPLAILSVVFVGCKDDDDDGPGTSSVTSISATVTGLGSDVDSVYLQVYPDNVVGTAFKNNQFQLNLPTLASKYLYSADFEDGIKVSDASAKATFDVDLVAYKEGIEVGTFYYTNLNTTDQGDMKSGLAEGWYVYADKDVKITGSYSEVDGKVTYTARWNVSLKAGWNIVAAVVKELSDTKEVYEYTTSLPGGLKWVYVPETYKSNQMSAMFRKVAK